MTEDQLAILAQQVEDAIRCHGSGEVPSHEVGLAILGPLRELDEVAYLRFASVYRGFESLADFEDEIAALRSEHRRAPACGRAQPGRTSGPAGTGSRRARRSRAAARAAISRPGRASARAEPASPGRWRARSRASCPVSRADSRTHIGTGPEQARDGIQRIPGRGKHDRDGERAGAAARGRQGR